MKIHYHDLHILFLYNIDPSWHPSEKEQVQAEHERLELALQSVGYGLTSIPVSNPNIHSILEKYNPENSLVLNWCEEIPGVPYSEALVAKALEEFHFTFTGSSSRVLYFCSDKRRVKKFLQKHGIPTPRWQVFTSANVKTWINFPAIVKPPKEHCSLGITPDAVVTSPHDLKQRVEYILDEFKQPALVEDFIDGREFHVSLWGNREIQMLPPAEMDFAKLTDVRDRLCTYDSKFLPGSFHYVNIGLKLPAPLTGDEYHRLEEICTRVYHLTGCRDYARLDIRMRNSTFFVLDVNPNPDISADASMACAAESLGYSYGHMLSRIISFAAERHPSTRIRKI